MGHQMSIGDVVGLAPPFGAFKMTPAPAVLISAGIGATPMQCFLRSAPESVRFILHVDKDEEAHPFRADMEAAGVPTHFHYTQKEGCRNYRYLRVSNKEIVELDANERLE